MPDSLEAHLAHLVGACILNSMYASKSQGPPQYIEFEPAAVEQL